MEKRKDILVPMLLGSLVGLAIYGGSRIVLNTITYSFFDQSRHLALAVIVVALFGKMIGAPLGSLLAAVLLYNYFNRSPPRHLCRKCGYDCRASPERCPECGTPRDRL